MTVVYTCLVSCARGTTGCDHLISVHCQNCCRSFVDQLWQLCGKVRGDLGVDSHDGYQQLYIIELHAFENAVDTKTNLLTTEID